MTKADLVQWVLDRWGNITSPKRLPILDREVADKLIEEHFPDSVKVEWNGTSSVAPTTDITVATTIAANTIKFTVYFWKSGNTVYFNGKIENNYANIFADFKIIDFATALYKPLTTSPIILNAEASTSGVPLTASSFRIKATFQGLSVFGAMSPSIHTFIFSGTYKVAN